MDIKILQFLFEVAKLVKSPLVYIKGNDLYGVDEQFVYLKHAKIENEYGISMAFSHQQMNNFLKNVDLNEIKFVGENILYSSFDNTLEINNLDLIHNIERMINSINGMLTTSFKKVVVNNIRSIPEFENILTYKSADGIGMFRYDKYVMTLYNNLLPIKKSDKLELNIYDINDRSFLSNFSIIRKKARIDVYIMYLHL